MFATVWSMHSRGLQPAGMPEPEHRSHALLAQAVPETLRQYNLLVVTLGEEPVPVLGLRAWNYNKSAADTARGIKRCIVLAGAGVRTGGRALGNACKLALFFSWGVGVGGWLALASPPCIAAA